jgi:hypothetical protein
MLFYQNLDCGSLAAVMQSAQRCVQRLWRACCTIMCKVNPSVPPNHGMIYQYQATLALVITVGALATFCYAHFPFQAAGKLRDSRTLAYPEEDGRFGCRQILEAGSNIKVERIEGTFVPTMAGNIGLKTFDEESFVSELVKTKNALGRVPHIVFTGDSNQMFRQNVLFALLQVSNGREGKREWSTYVSVEKGGSRLVDIEFIRNSFLEYPTKVRIRPPF